MSRLFMVCELGVALLFSAFCLVSSAQQAQPNINDQAARIDMFSPEGTVKGVRQVTARFSEAIVPFGDPRVVEPFDIQCLGKGTARWADSRNWVYDFDHDLPAGLKCSFSLKRDLKTLSGKKIVANSAYSFSTGGPAIIQSIPYEGAENIDEDQVFILGLDAPATEESIQKSAYCETDNSVDKIGVRLIKGEERKNILEQRRDFMDRYFRVLFENYSGRLLFSFLMPDRGSKQDQLIKMRDGDHSPIVVLQCRLRLPNQTPVHLVWGKGITSESGVATDNSQSFTYKTRDVFRARFSCDRVNQKSGCIPVLPMRLDFTASILRVDAEKITLNTEDGKVYRPQFNDQGDEKEEYVNGVTFKGPFPESKKYKINLPQGLKDDANRPLANASNFPLAVKTDENPPLAKFAANFGIVELKAGALLPVTVRNLEPNIATELWKQSSQKATSNLDQSISGAVVSVDPNAIAEIINWFDRMNAAEQDVWQYDPEKRQNIITYHAGSTSIFESSDKISKLKMPKPNGSKAFEVIGIPLRRPGFYVVELASPRLGAALLDEKKPFYVHAAALVTNLSVHLKLGRESSLVWVTALDSGKPVPQAAVSVFDCHSKSYWQGSTDVNGIAQIGQSLPAPNSLGCLNSPPYIVTARVKDDMAFAFSNWDEGIASWRFGFQSDSYGGPYIATTVFDRTLLRAGETVHMKHLIRMHSGTGFAPLPADQLANHIVIRHEGSDEHFDIPVTWDEHATAISEWAIPKEAKQGVYDVYVVEHLAESEGSSAIRPRHFRRNNDLPSGTSTPEVIDNERPAGSFRVEAFRVPTMKAILKPPRESLVNAQNATLDIQLNYLSGGGAGNAQVRLRSLLQPKTVTFPDYDGFTFANGNVKEGIQDDRAQPWKLGEYTWSDEDEGDEEREEAPTPSVDDNQLLANQAITLDQAGAGRFTVSGLPKGDAPRDLLMEAEYRDANGETLTTSTHIPLWPAKVLVGLKPDSWAASKKDFKFKAIAVDLRGKPIPGARIDVDLFQNDYYSHRKRLIGGFYAYESFNEVKRVGSICSGITDNHGLLFCSTKSPVSGNVILRAKTTDAEGNVSYANRDTWIAGKDEWWFNVSDSDRIDVIPERKSYEPGDSATFQVRMPFRQATALITIEREGVLDSFVQPLSGKAPIVRIPIKDSYAPNVYVSVFVIRGRVAGVQPTALIDLGKPAFKLGIADINVGWRGHELKVNVSTDKQVYKVRDKAQVTVNVTCADGSIPPPESEVALAAVDEGLLDLMPNDSWKLLETMMSHRGIEVQTSTAQMQVIGKRHYGRKALPQGGGGGRQTARELFDTLLFWQARVKLDDKGLAHVTVPLNDSLTSFRIVAIADADFGLFGTGDTAIRSTQDVMLLSGLPPVVRERDQYFAGFTVRNASDHSMTLQVEAKLKTEKAADSPILEPQLINLDSGEARDVGWGVTVPVNTKELKWEVSAYEKDAVANNGDKLRITQKVIPAVAVRTFQATIAQLDKSFGTPVQIPGDAIAGRGGIAVHLRSRLGDELDGVREYMDYYPYSCLEQRVSQAVALGDKAAWDRVMASLSSYLDNDGLAKYFPLLSQGSDVLTTYILSIADEAGWAIPAPSKERMEKALKQFTEGRIVRDSDLPTADLTIRKIAAIDALSRDKANVDLEVISSLAIEPNLWPTSAVIDWYDLLNRQDSIPDRDKQSTEAENIIRSRLNFQGTTMGFSTERSDFLWWLMISGDVNANRVLLAMLNNDSWREDIPRLVRGTIGRQQHGHWNTTVANAWGVLALQKFSEKFESVPVTGVTKASLAGQKREFDWKEGNRDESTIFDWPPRRSDLSIEHDGTGKPWVTVQSLAAIPLKDPFSSGYKIERSIAPVEQRTKGVWSRGDVVRVHLDLEAQSDMTWVVVRDPIPAGSAILGTGLGGDSSILSRDEKKRGWVWPAFEERTFDSFFAYYRFVPKGRWSVEYTLRLNNPGIFVMPETRVEAMYSPEMFGEIPNLTFEVRP